MPQFPKYFLKYSIILDFEAQNPEFRNNPENFHPCVLENIMESGAFALLEQMLHFPYFLKYSNLNLNFS